MGDGIFLFECVFPPRDLGIPGFMDFALVNWLGDAIE